MITLLGATGYTGRLIAAELSRQGVALRLAGRSRSRLNQLRSQLPGPTSIVLVDVQRRQTLTALADTDLLINCVGPYTDLGKPVAAFAARNGLRYLDITNELGYTHEVYSVLPLVARASGAVLVPACGFEVALADCAAALLARELPPGELERIVITYKLPGSGSSYGTRASALRSLATSWLTYRNGALEPARPCNASGEVRLGGKMYPTLSFPSSETVTIPAQLRVRNIHIQMTITRFGALYGPWLIPALIPLLNGPVGWALRLLSRYAARPPRPEHRTSMPFALLVSAESGAQSASITLRGLDPYGLTAKIVAYAAKHLHEAQLSPGVLAPAQILPAAHFFEAVREWGVTISFDTQSRT